MKITEDFSTLWKKVRRITPDTAPFNLSFDVRPYRDIDVELFTGWVVSLSELENTGGLLSYKGRQVLLYIPDQSSQLEDVIEGNADGMKFHVAHCQTLESMRQSGRYQRYVATTNLSGFFKVSGIDRRGKEAEGTARLRVCINCLRSLNFCNSINVNSATRLKLAQDFSIQSFFEYYSSCFKYTPHRTDSDDIKSDYVSNWSDLSNKIRSEENFKCRSCSVSLHEVQRLCHVHHLNGNKADNSAANLVVLCAACHKIQPRHSRLFLPHDDMKIISTLRRMQGIDVVSWESALKLADTALYGVLCMARNKGLTPPVFGHVLDSGHGTQLVADAAWISESIAVFIYPPANHRVGGWRVFGIEGALIEFS